MDQRALTFAEQEVLKCAQRKEVIVAEHWPVIPSPDGD